MGRGHLRAPRYAWEEPAATAGAGGHTAEVPATLQWRSFDPVKMATFHAEKVM